MNDRARVSESRGAVPRPARLGAIAPSRIRENMRIAKEVGAINLAQGRPGFDPDPRLVEAATEALRGGHHQYSVTWGVEELRVAIAEALGERFGLNVDPETEVTVTCGVTEGMVAAMLALVDAGDEVIVLEPAHENYVPAIHFAGGRPRSVAMRPPHFDLPLDEVAGAIGPRTRAIIVNTPNNPSGRVLVREELEDLLSLAERHGVAVITDEIYERIVYPPAEHICPAALAPDHPAIITTGGISKIHAVTGWRLGYVVAPPAITEAIRTVHDYLTICAPTPLQHAAITALRFPETYYTDVLDRFVERRDRALAMLRGAGLEPHEPEGAYYILAGFPRWDSGGDSERIARELIKEAGVATVPGTAFYLDHPGVGRGLLRFSFAVDLETLDDAGVRLREYGEALT